MKFPKAIYLTILLAWPGHASAESTENPSLAQGENNTVTSAKIVIRSLYQEHQPFRGDMPPKKEIQWGAADNREQLSRYFDSSLTDLFLRDAECGEKTKEVCALDWDPIYDAQDGYPDDSNVAIEMCSPMPHLQYCVTTGHSKQKIRYSMVQTAAGWRIADIEDWEDNDQWLSIKKLFLTYKFY